MFRNFTVLSLVLLFSFSIFAQDLQVNPQKISRLKQVVANQPLTASLKNNTHKINDVQALHPVISMNGYYDSTYEEIPCPRWYYTSALYFVSAAEMAAAGIVSGTPLNEIAWSYYHYPTSTVTGTLKVYLQNTSDASNLKTAATWATAIGTMTLAANNSSFQMYNGQDYPTQALSGFTYTGGGLYIAWDLANTSIVTKGDQLVQAITGGEFGGTTMWRSQTVTPPTKLGTLSAYRPETYLGTPLVNDASVLEVYTLGKLPIPFATPHTIVAAIGNPSDNDLYSKAVTLTVSGANSYTETITLDTLLSGYYYEVSFTAWTPTNYGTNTVTVTIPSDADNTNNTKSVTQLINTDAYTYAYGPFPATADGGVGFNNGTGDFVAKFSSSSASSVNQLSVNFDGGGQQYKLGIWAADGVGGIPGTKLWESGINTSASGVNTILVNPKVNVNGAFYAGVIQMNTTNVGFAYQSEDPVRSGTFYYTSPTGTSTWTDFAATASPFRFMIEPRLTVANDVGASTFDYPTTYGTLISNVAPKATIANFGLNNQSSAFNVTMRIYDATNALVYTDTKSVSSLNAGASQQVTFAATFNPTAQVYTAKCFSLLGTDGERLNDTAFVTFTYESSFSLGISALIEGFYDAGSGLMVSDTVTAEVRSAAVGHALLGSQKVLLSTAGMGTLTGISAPLTNLSNCYLVIKHRNAVETWSNGGQLFYIGSLSTYSFETDATQAYGSNMKQKGSLWCLFSGDANHDGIVDSGDLGVVDNDNANYVSGYTDTDVNGDGIVDSGDLGIVDNNNANYVGAVVPSNAHSAVHVNKLRKNN